MCFRLNPILSHCVPLATHTALGPLDLTLCAPTTHTPVGRDLWYKRYTSFKDLESYFVG